MNPLIPIIIVSIIVVGIILLLVHYNEQSSSPSSEWSCYKWTAEDLARIQAGTPEATVCTGYGYTFTGGNNRAYFGCGTCWCCKEN